MRLIALLVAVGLLAGCGGSEMPADETSKPTPAATKDAPAPTTPKGKLQAAASSSGVRGAKVKKIDAGLWEVQFKVRDNLSKGTIRTGIAKDVYAMAEPISKTDVKFKELAIRGTFPLTDEFGNTEPGQVFYTTFTRATLRKIDYDNPTALTFENMERLVIDGIVVLHPDFR